MAKKENGNRKTLCVMIDGISVALGCPVCVYADKHVDTPRSPCYKCFMSGSKNGFKLDKKYRKLEQKEV